MAGVDQTAPPIEDRGAAAERPTNCAANALQADIPLDGPRAGVERVEVVVPGADVDHSVDLARGGRHGTARRQEPDLVQRPDGLGADHRLASVEARLPNVVAVHRPAGGEGRTGSENGYSERQPFHALYLLGRTKRTGAPLRGNPGGRGARPPG